MSRKGLTICTQKSFWFFLGFGVLAIIWLSLESLNQAKKFMLNEIQEIHKHAKMIADNGMVSESIQMNMPMFTDRLLKSITQNFPQITFIAIFDQTKHEIFSLSSENQDIALLMATEAIIYQNYRNWYLHDHPIEKASPFSVIVAVDKQDLLKNFTFISQFEISKEKLAFNINYLKLLQFNLVAISIIFFLLFGLLILYSRSLNLIKQYVLVINQLAKGTASCIKLPSYAFLFRKHVENVNQICERFHSEQKARQEAEILATNEKEKSHLLHLTAMCLAHDLEPLLAASEEYICCVQDFLDSPRNQDNFVDLKKEEISLRAEVKLAAELVHNFRHLTTEYHIKEHAHINLTSLLLEIMEWSQIKLNNKPIQLVRNFHHSKTILGDPVGLKRVFFNLLKNAIEAVNMTGKISVTTHDWNHRVKVSIRNTGSFIPQKEVPDLFKPYHSQKSLGRGLGLHIVKNILDKHGFEIKLFSDEKNLETEFSVIM